MYNTIIVMLGKSSDVVLGIYATFCYYRSNFWNFLIVNNVIVLRKKVLLLLLDYIAVRFYESSMIKKTLRCITLSLLL